MNRDELLRRPAVPLTAPPYPLRVPRFVDREYFNVVYRTDPDALRAAVPEPLGVGEPLVRFEVLHMGDVDGYGSYTECGQVLKVLFDGAEGGEGAPEEGEYLHAMYLDNAGAVLAGREWDSYPKSLGTPRLFTEASTLVGTLDYGSQRIATATMPYKYEPMDTAAALACVSVPTFAVKVVPRPPDSLYACDLVRTRITGITVKQAWQGPARLQLFEHVMAPLADLPVREVVSASYILADLTLSPFFSVHD